MPRLAVVLNPTKPVADAVRAVVAAAEAAHGWEQSLWYETTVEDPGVGMARVAVDDGADVVLAVGGDGTVRAVAEGMKDSGVPLAICPQGTGNLLARNLGLPLDDVVGAVELAFGGVDRSIDLAVVALRRIDGTRDFRIYTVMAGVGLDAQIMSNTDEQLKARVGMLAYVQTGAVEVGRNRRMQVGYRIEGGRQRRTRAQMVLVGNCGSIGYNVFLMPDASLDDGRLDLMMAKPASLVGWLVVGWRVFVDYALVRRLRRKAGRREDRFTSYIQATQLTLEFDEPEQIELDGDHFGQVTAAHFAVAPGSLVVKVRA